MDAEAFLNASQRAPPPAPVEWLRAIFKTMLGAILLWVVDAIHSTKRSASARVGGNVGTHPAPSFRHFPNRRAPLAKRWRQCKSHRDVKERLHEAMDKVTAKKKALK